MKKSTSLDRMNKRYQALCSRLVQPGPILQGSVSERIIKGKEGQKQKPGKTYGPYYQWTFKESGKTVTVNLTRQQAQKCRKAISNNKKLEETLKEMRVLSRKILEAKTKGVNKRKLQNKRRKA